LEWAVIFALAGNTDVVEKLEGKGQKKLLKADCEPCCSITWSDKQAFSLS